MTKLWEEHKKLIIRLYKTENRSLKDVIEIMRVKHGFNASIRAYRSRLTSWGIHKYTTRRRRSSHSDTLGSGSASPPQDSSQAGSSGGAFLGNPSGAWSQGQADDSVTSNGYLSPPSLDDAQLPPTEDNPNVADHRSLPLRPRLPNPQMSADGGHLASPGQQDDGLPSPHMAHRMLSYPSTFASYPAVFPTYTPVLSGNAYGGQHQHQHQQQQQQQHHGLSQQQQQQRPPQVVISQHHDQGQSQSHAQGQAMIRLPRDYVSDSSYAQDDAENDQVSREYAGLK